MKVSVIIPAYNEEAVIGDCLLSSGKQTFKDLEVVIVDDGSSDKTLSILSEFKIRNLEFRILKQDHKGAGVARNLGAKEAKGEILVFVDADMVFDRFFIEKLTEPIIQGKGIGTFSREEYVLNKDNVWSKCWNINKGLPANRMHPENYPDEQPVFRAILRKEFQKVGGFTAIGYIDDHTLSEKLGVMAKVAPGAVFFHLNPASLGEIYHQARWIGKSEFKRRKVKDENLMRLLAMIRYSLPLSIINGAYKAIIFGSPQFLIFKIVYDLAVEVSLIRSFFAEQKYR